MIRHDTMEPILQPAGMFPHLAIGVQSSVPTFHAHYGQDRVQIFAQYPKFWGSVCVNDWYALDEIEDGIQEMTALVIKQIEACIDEMTRHKQRLMRREEMEQQSKEELMA